MWWVSLLGAALAVLSGALEWSVASGVLERIAPVLVFLIGITVIAALTDAAGVFDVAARGAAHLGRGRTWRLWLMVVALASASTIVLSLDTTAVLLTPVALSMARQLAIPPRLFAMTTVWLAGTASLLLPASNLTNVLATHRLDALGIGLGGGARVGVVGVVVDGYDLVVRVVQAAQRGEGLDDHFGRLVVRRDVQADERLVVGVLRRRARFDDVAAPVLGAERITQLPLVSTGEPAGQNLQRPQDDSADRRRISAR